MSIENRIAALEARHHEREADDAPLYLQHADRDDDGNVVSCERLTFPRNPPNVDALGPMAAAAAAMKRESFKREACVYDGCEHRADCRADGSPTRWGK